jgi:hypothetical protein
MSTARVVAKATKLAWQRDVARLYYHMLCQLHLERRWIPNEELALAGEEFLSLFRARFVDRTFRCSMLDDGPDDIVSSYNCAGQDGVNVFVAAAAAAAVVVAAAAGQLQVLRRRPMVVQRVQAQQARTAAGQPCGRRPSTRTPSLQRCFDRSATPTPAPATAANARSCICSA